MVRRIKETELSIPALSVMAEQKNGKVRVSQLIKKLEDKMNPQGEDADILDGRNDTKLSQKVRNLVSHRNSSTNIIKKGYVEYSANDQSLTITDEGMDYLNQRR